MGFLAKMGDKIDLCRCSLRGLLDLLKNFGTEIVTPEMAIPKHTESGIVRDILIESQEEKGAVDMMIKLFRYEDVESVWLFLVQKEKGNLKDRSMPWKVEYDSAGLKSILEDFEGALVSGQVRCDPVADS